MYIARRTFGFQKSEDAIALSQFVSGIQDKNGNQLDYGAGVSKPKVIEALALLEYIGVIKSADGRVKKYSVVKKLNPSEVVKKLNQRGKETLPKVVKKLNPQKKGNKVNKIKGESAQKDLPEWLNKEAWDEWVLYRKQAGKKLTPLSITKQINFLSKHIPDHKRIIEEAIKNGWQGLHELKKQDGGGRRFLTAQEEDRIRARKEAERYSQETRERNERLNQLMGQAAMKIG